MLPALATPKEETKIAPDVHSKLVTVVLAKAVDVLEETLNIDPYTSEMDPETKEVVRTFNGRLNGQRLRAAIATVSLVERLGDQALRRQAGKQMSRLLKAIKRERNKGTIDG